LQVEPKSFEGDKLVMEITPMMQIIASTADDVEDAVTESDQPSGVNAVVVKAASEIQVTAPVTVSFTLPDNYITSDERVYMEHVKKGTTYVYDVDVDGSNVATFTNPHGFSTFTLTKSGPVAKIGEVGYTSLQAAVDDVKDGETITLVGSTDETSVTVSKAVTFTLVDNGNSTDVEKYFTGDITNAYGYTVVNNNGEYTVTKNPYYYVPSTSTGDSAVDKPADEETADAIAAVEATQLKAQTKQVKVNGKAAVKVTWKAADGSDLDLDGVEIFRSVKRYSGYTAKPIFTTTKAQYYNTAVKAGTKYYYKVRGYKTIDGEKVYTGFSTKAWRTVK
jgi:hypothetical protein